MMKKKPTKRLPRGPRTTPSGTKYKPVSASTTRKQVDAKLKEAPAKIKISNVKVSTRENFGTSQRRAGSMTSSGLPRSSKPVAPKPKTTKKPLTASEKAFIKNQKEKAKAVKRTGIYPNTAN